MVGVSNPPINANDLQSNIITVVCARSYKKIDNISRFYGIAGVVL